MSQSIVGIDVGALSAKAVLLDSAGQTINHAYRFHQGSPVAVLRDLLGELTNNANLQVALTGSGANLCPPHEQIRAIDEVQAVIAASAQKFPTARNILDIGGASLTLVRLDSAGKFRGFSANSQCAAGTGSFLDEQAMRLGLTYDQISELDGVSDPPSVATRCAVFAKSDLIHLQQAGATGPEMWSGLCRGMSQTALQTLLKGKPLGAVTALVGGVAQNREVLRWLRELADAELVTDPQAHLTGALGAALVVLADSSQPAAIDWREWLNSEFQDSAAPDTSAPESCGRTSQSEDSASVFASEHADEPLALTRTSYPSFEVLESYTDEKLNEVRISQWPDGEIISGTLGIDVGSTSTKLCLISEEGDVLVDIYRKTAGDPIGATKLLFDALRETAAKRGGSWQIVGCGTTGSGRKLVGAVVGADAAINEISAHVAGAMHTDPELETIFEIGGQDSKYMRTKNGAIADANMNYVCAAGTGSFVEEQARKLGVPLSEVGDQVLGLIPPQSSDRCTVFMEQDVNKLLRSGSDSSHALAAVMRSVVQNYLNKVVGNRPYSRCKIGFLGATARNKGLVAAFETLLGVEMVVSPYCHVMGAWGVALLTQNKLLEEKRPTSFVGLDLSKRKTTLRREICDLCQNECELTFAAIEGNDHEPSWGYLCGRDPEDQKMRVHREYDLFRKRQRWLWRDGAAPHGVRSRKGRDSLVVGIPRALASYSHLPLWRRLLEELGAKVVLTEQSGRDTKERGAALTGADFCFPVKLAHGQVAQGVTADGIDYLFVPRMVAQPPTGQQSNTFFCPYLQAFPAVVQAALSQAGYPTSRMLMPTIDRRLSISRQVRMLHTELGRPLAVSEPEVRRAFAAACAAQDGFERRCQETGQRTLDVLATETAVGCSGNRPGIVFIGRPYNLNDTGVNLDLPCKIAEMGFPAIPIDFLEFDPDRIDPRYHNVFWAYGQRIISALEYVRKRDDLFAVYFTNFNCGPDSFLLSYAEEIMGDKPMLSLELDEHGADAGYITRIEAFLDVARSWKPTPGAPRLSAPDIDLEELRRRRIWIPPMHPVGSELFAAAFRGEGFDAVALPNETRDDLELGQRLTRGCECLPMRTTVGGLFNALENAPKDGKKHAFFMPTAKGPCRFGQYATLHQLIFDRAGRDEIMILSPSSDNTYHGLSEELRRTMWKALLTSDILFKLACRIRPYEKNVGDTDQALAAWTKTAIAAVEQGRDVRTIIRRACESFEAIPTRDERRPLVGIVGEIYVRNNRFSNEDVIRAIERAGGEVWMTPLTEWLLFTSYEDSRKLVELPKNLMETFTHGKRILKSRWMQADETAIYKAAGPILADRHEPHIRETVREGQRYLPFNIGGEAILSLGRAVHFARQGAALVVNASPFSCMAGTVCAAIFAHLEHEMGVPVVNMFYDGTGDQNSRLEVFLANLSPDDARSGPPRAQNSRKSGIRIPFISGSARHQ